MNRERIFYYLLMFLLTLRACILRLTLLCDGQRVWSYLASGR